MPYWTRQRSNDRHYYVLHKDWILGDVQFSWQELPRVSRGPLSYGIYCRKKRGIFGWGCTKWYYIHQYDEFEEMCKTLNRIIDENNEQYWHDVIQREDEDEAKQEREDLDNKFCGFGSDKAIGWGY
jgi:Zn-finger protein